MEGVVDSVIRDLFSKIGGYDQFVTEFVRITHQLLPNHVFYKYCPELHTKSQTLEGTPVFIQLLGGDPQCMAENAHKAIELGAAGIDINFGCPAKTVNRHDGGAALLKKPSRLFDVVSAIRKAVPKTHPVTAKVRLGFDHKDDTLDIAQAVNDGGAQRLTVHARTKTDGYRPPAYWHYLKAMKESITIPLVANGDIWTVNDFFRCQEITGCHHFALGRPAMANPFLALQIKAQLSLTQQTESQEQPSWPTLKHQWLPYFIAQSQQHRGDLYALSRTKQWSRLLGREFPEALQFFEQIKRAKELPSLFEKFPSMKISHQ